VSEWKDVCNVAGILSKHDTEAVNSWPWFWSRRVPIWRHSWLQIGHLGVPIPQTASPKKHADNQPTNMHFSHDPRILLNKNRCKFRVKCSRYGKRIRVSLIAMHENPRQVMTEVQTKLLYKYNQTESKTYSMPIIRLGLCLCMQGHILSNPVVFSRPVCPFNTVY